MSRIKIQLPEKFTFSTTLAIRITDINYGGHVGNDTVLSIIHEVRMRFLKSLGYSELDFGGAGLIMSDVGIEFKNELFYDEMVIASVTISEISKVAFEIYYKLEKKKGDRTVVVALAKTGMVCYDYQKKRITAVPEEVKEKLSGS
ncbi:MAG: esterase [Chitinophagaceae bacterium]|nr:esterase [Chitinophagaceae bacterium]